MSTRDNLTRRVEALEQKVEELLSRPIAPALAPASESTDASDSADGEQEAAA